MTVDKTLPPAVADGSWAEAVQAAIGAEPEAVQRACAVVRARIDAAVAALPEQDAHPVVVELLYAYDAARDLLRRWAQATEARDGSVLGAATADILLNDLRPVRPYAVQLGEWMTEYEQRLSDALAVPGSRATSPVVVSLRVEVEVDLTRWAQDACEGQDEPDPPVADQITGLIAATLASSERAIAAGAAVRVRPVDTTTAPTSLAHTVVTNEIEVTVVASRWWATTAPAADRTALTENVRAHVDCSLANLPQFTDVGTVVVTAIVP